MNSAIHLRFASENDADDILRLVKELAHYEKADNEVSATPELLKEWIFEKKAAEALLVVHEYDGVVGCAVFFQNFSTWKGEGGMYLEDLYIEERHRGGGIGRRLMAELARICRERGWSRFDWSCLDWNTPSLGFYRSIGATQMNEWVHHRLTGEALELLAAEAVGVGMREDKVSL